MEKKYLFTIHYSFTKQIGVLKGWIFTHLINLDIKINFQNIIFLFLFLVHFSLGAQTNASHCICGSCLPRLSTLIPQQQQRVWTFCSPAPLLGPWPRAPPPGPQPRALGGGSSACPSPRPSAPSSLSTCGWEAPSARMESQVKEPAANVHQPA